MEKLCELFTTQPGYKILDITAHADGISEMLAAALASVGGRLALAEYPGAHRTFAVPEGVSLQRQCIDDYARPFRALPRDNDIVFVRDVLHRHAQPERLLRAVYTTLANAAEIVVVTRADDADTSAQLAMLEAADFRAGNVIEGIVEGSVVVMAKKMHMWGRGL